jgi:hypothetical protein
MQPRRVVVRGSSSPMVAVQIAFDFARAVAAVMRPALTRRDSTATSKLNEASASNALDATALVKPTRERRLGREREAKREATSDTTSSAAATRDALTLSLEQALRARVNCPLRLTITDNRRTMLSLRRRPQFVEVRLHHMFLSADAQTRDALGDYLFDGERGAAQSIGRFIERNRTDIRRAERRPIAISTAGTHHDLAEICRAVNDHYFAGAVNVRITWGRAGTSARAPRSIKLGSYTSRDQLIRVHPALDAAFVPRFFLDYIVYHEMLHHVVPPKRERGRRDLHGAAFKARERMFDHYEAALRWERHNLDRLLRRSLVGRGAPKRAPKSSPTT